MSKLRVFQIVFAFVLLFVPGCGGDGCEGSGSPVLWEILGPQFSIANSQGLAEFGITVRHNAGTGTHVVNLTIENVPDGWTASIDPTSVSVDPNGSAHADVEVQIPAGTPIGSFKYIQFVGTDTNGTVRATNVQVVNGDPISTKIEKITDFTPAADGLYVSQFKVYNGPPNQLIGSLLNSFVPNVRYWYRPDNILNLDVDEIKDYELVAMVTNSAALGPHTIEAKFEKQGIAYAYTSLLAPTPLSELAFDIQTIDLNIKNSMIGDTASFQVTVDLPPGKQGNYTLTIESLSPGLMATVTPPTFMINPAGDPVTFEVTIQRTSADAGHGWGAHEPVIVGTHESNPETNFRQAIPLFADP